MAPVEISVTDLSAFAPQKTLTGTTGDAANDHDINADSAPRIHLLVTNSHSSPIAFVVVANNTSRTGVRGGSVTQAGGTVPAAAAGIEGKTVTTLDASALIRRDSNNLSGEVILVNGSDANFNLLTFYAYTWTPTSVT